MGKLSAEFGLGSQLANRLRLASGFRTRGYWAIPVSLTSLVFIRELGVGCRDLSAVFWVYCPVLVKWLLFMPLGLWFE